MCRERPASGREKLTGPEPAPNVLQLMQITGRRSTGHVLARAYLHPKLITREGEHRELGGVTEALKERVDPTVVHVAQASRRGDVDDQRRFGTEVPQR